jgi:hypothetical protein
MMVNPYYVIPTKSASPSSTQEEVQFIHVISRLISHIDALTSVRRFYAMDSRLPNWNPPLISMLRHTPAFNFRVIRASPHLAPPRSAELPNAHLHSGPQRRFPLSHTTGGFRKKKEKEKETISMHTITRETHTHTHRHTCAHTQTHMRTHTPSRPQERCLARARARRRPPLREVRFSSVVRHACNMACSGSRPIQTEELSNSLPLSLSPSRTGSRDTGG